MLDKYMAICEVIGADPVMLLAEAMAGDPEDKQNGRQKEERTV